MSSSKEHEIKHSSTTAKEHKCFVKGRGKGTGGSDGRGKDGNFSLRVRREIGGEKLEGQILPGQDDPQRRTRDLGEGVKGGLMEDQTTLDINPLEGGGVTKSADVLDKKMIQSQAD